MKTFKEYIVENSDMMQPVESEENPVLNKIIAIAWHKYKDQTDKFLRSLAEDDPEISKEYSKINSEALVRPSKSDELFGKQDKPVPPMADTGSDYPDD